MRKRSSEIRGTCTKKSTGGKKSAGIDGEKENGIENFGKAVPDTKRAIMLAVLGAILLIGTSRYYVGPSIKSGVKSVKEYRRERQEKYLQKEWGIREEEKAAEERAKKEKKAREEERMQEKRLAKERLRKEQRLREKDKLRKLRERAAELKAILKDREREQDVWRERWSVGHIIRGVKTFFKALCILLVFLLTILVALQMLHVRYVKRESVNEYIAYLKSDIKRRAKIKIQPLLIEEAISGLMLLSNKDKMSVKKEIYRDSNIEEISVLVNLQKHKAWQWIGPQEVSRPR